MRRKPYTERGLSRVPCFRCSKPSTQQWQICSLGNEYKGVCTECDIALNELVLKFMGVKDIKQIIKHYRKARNENT